MRRNGAYRNILIRRKLIKLKPGHKPGFDVQKLFVMESNYYLAQIKNDKGLDKIWVAASDEQAARVIIQSAMACPANAIKSIKQKTRQQFKRRSLERQS